MIKKTIDFRNISRRYTIAELETDRAPQDSINTGTRLRIADALERLATGKTELETQDELAKARIDVGILRRERDYQKLQIAGLRGVITKLQKKLKETRK